MASVWNDQAVVARAVALWKGGYSAGRIAVMLRNEHGVSVTRNAVIGKLHRLRMTDRGDPRFSLPSEAAERSAARKAAQRAEAERRKAERRKAERARLTEAQREADRLAREAVEHAKRAPWLALSGSNPLVLEQRCSGQCAWPIGEHPNFTFCCEPVQDGKSYCRTHQRMSIARDQPRRLAARDAAWLSGERRRAA